MLDLQPLSCGLASVLPDRRRPAGGLSSVLSPCPACPAACLGVLELVDGVLLQQSKGPPAPCPSGSSDPPCALTSSLEEKKSMNFVFCSGIELLQFCAACCIYHTDIQHLAVQFHLHALLA